MPAGAWLERKNKMDEEFALFFNDVPTKDQAFVSELDVFLLEKGSKRTIKAAKSGYLTSYTSPKTGKILLNYVFRKTGVKIRIYAQNVEKYDELLADIPDNMKKDIIKAGDCKKLTGGKCSSICTGGYIFQMDNVEYRKCKNMAFFHSLTEENYDAILGIIKSEIGKN